jgi:hypothetical protein
LGFTDTIDDGIWKFSDVTLNPDTKACGHPMGLEQCLRRWGSLRRGGRLNQFASVPLDTLFNLIGHQVATAPEPGTLALMAGAAGLLAAFRRRKA